MDTEQLAVEVAARLRAERARANLTLREAGARAGVHYVSIGRYEKGNHLPTLDALYRLAKVYGVEATVLLPPTACIGDLPKGRKGKK